MENRGAQKHSFISTLNLKVFLAAYLLFLSLFTSHLVSGDSSLVQFHLAAVAVPGIPSPAETCCTSPGWHGRYMRQ